MNPAPTLRRAAWRSALIWAAAWGLLGVSCKGARGTADVMGPDAFWPVLAIGGVILGMRAGAVYSNLRARIRAPARWQRNYDGKLGFSGRLGAAGFGALVTGIPGVLAIRGGFLVMLGTMLAFGLLGAVTAFVFPGSGDIARRSAR